MSKNVVFIKKNGSREKSFLLEIWIFIENNRFKIKPFYRSQQNGIENVWMMLGKR